MARAVGAAAVTVAALLAPALAHAEMCVGVDLQFPGVRPPSPVVVQTLTQETASIWMAYGVRVDFESGRGCAELDGTFDAVFERRMRSETAPSGEVVLGNTYLRLRIDHAPIRVDYDATERIVRSLPDERLLAVAGHHGIGSVEIGRALGRVLAHEMGHVLLAMSAHQPRGLMRASFRPADLAAMDRSTFTLSPNELSRLNSRLRALA